MNNKIAFDNRMIALQLIEILVEKGQINQETYTRIMKNVRPQKLTHN